MITDSARMSAYQRAIAQSVGQGDVVVDLGAGTGVLSLLACQAGAGHVYAIDTNPLIERGFALAQANGYQDRITFVRGDALAFRPDREVNVVIGDVRGSLPLVSGLELYRDATQRYVASGASIVPQRDQVFLAPLSQAKAYRSYVEEPWSRNQLGLDLTPELERSVATPINSKLSSGHGLMEPQLWGQFDYIKGESKFAHRIFDWQAEARTTLHFLAVWFDSVLAQGVEYTNAPGAGGPNVYGQILLPLEKPLDIETGDTIEVRLRTNADYSVWSWNTDVHRDGNRFERLRQSSLGAFNIDAIRRHRDGVPA